MCKQSCCGKQPGSYCSFSAGVSLHSIPPHYFLSIVPCSLACSRGQNSDVSWLRHPSFSAGECTPHRSIARVKPRCLWDPHIPSGEQQQVSIVSPASLRLLWPGRAPIGGCWAAPNAPESPSTLQATPGHRFSGPAPPLAPRAEVLPDMQTSKCRQPSSRAPHENKAQAFALKLAS